MLHCRAIREAAQWSEDRKKIALEACKAVGAVMDDLEERNEMFETPLIREAADGNSKNVLLLLEAGADVDAQQDNSIGFTALHQAGSGSLSLFSYQVALTMLDVQRTLGIPNVWCSCCDSGLRWTRLMPLGEPP